MSENRDQFKVKRMCDLFGVSKSGFYAWLGRPVSGRKQYDQELKSVIEERHQGFRRAYGAARLHKDLCRLGYACSRRRVRRLMCEMGIKASTCGLYQWRPGLHEFYSATGNLLGRESSPEQPGVQWAGDFTYIRTGKGCLYHAVVLDLYSRKVVGWSFAKQRSAEFAMSALRMALSRERISAGCIFHSDQGIEYAAHDYRELVETSGLQRSMSRKGDPLDNATVESYFHTLKAELVHLVSFKDRIEAVAKIVEYIEFYNRERLHSQIGYTMPEERSRLCA
ncbi:IS3 family transposase [Parahaliea aestuarii]|uniref:IS3 family transposase n=1 Tax=Parahaliea aestuarii TaxID=1852021 RepID=UPI001FE93B22|nr:IS3 family transposase [Parahaliea aestuarii]